MGAMAIMGMATARGLLRLSPVTAMAATTEATTAAMAIMGMATARGLLRLSPDTAMAATATATATDTAMATATTVEHRCRCHLNLQTYKSPCICDQLRVLNYARNKKNTVVLEVKFIFEL